MRFATLATIVLSLSAGLAEAQQAGPPALPAGEGRDLVAAACTQCHATNAFTQMRIGPEGWRHQVYDMVLRGAQVQPSELNTIVTYLTTHFGPGVNVPPSVMQVALPDGDGKLLVEQLCTLCHGLDRAVGTPRSRQEWDSIMARMVFLGAPVAGEQRDTLTTYLKEKVARD